MVVTDCKAIRAAATMKHTASAACICLMPMHCPVEWLLLSGLHMLYPASAAGAVVQVTTQRRHSKNTA